MQNADDFRASELGGSSVRCDPMKLYKLAALCVISKEMLQKFLKLKESKFNGQYNHGRLSMNDNLGEDDLWYGSNRCLHHGNNSD